jgi:hypothetical protein
MPLDKRPRPCASGTTERMKRLSRNTLHARLIRSHLPHLAARSFCSAAGSGTGLPVNRRAARRLRAAWESSQAC